MEKRKIILDCDPGQDDAVAIMMAAKHPAIDLLGITIVAGNQTLENTVRNGLNILSHLDLEAPLYAGCSQPMVRRQVTAGHIHGETGLDGPVFGPLTRAPEPGHAVQFIIDTLMASDGGITLVPTGPLTNIAMAMRLEPRIVEKIREIVLMGGSCQLGNVTPAAEFNIYADAEAAHVVFHSNCPIVMMGLDVTMQALCDAQIIRRMEKIGNPASTLFADLMHFFTRTRKEVFGWDAGPLHDPVCIAYLIDPSCFEVREMFTEIEIRSESCYGRTLCDYYHVTGNEPNARVALKLDADRFWDIVEESIRRYSN